MLRQIWRESALLIAGNQQGASPGNGPPRRS